VVGIAMEMKERDLNDNVEIETGKRAMIKLFDH
jgi:hypothetical protein